MYEICVTLLLNAGQNLLSSELGYQQSHCWSCLRFTWGQSLIIICPKEEMNKKVIRKV